jgi:hypothetical protein
VTDSSDVLEPGTPSSDPSLTAYWFGPTLGPRRTIVATETRVDMSNTDEPKLFPLLRTGAGLLGPGSRGAGHERAAGNAADSADDVGRTFVTISGLPPDRAREFLHQVRPVD